MGNLQSVAIPSEICIVCISEKRNFLPHQLFLPTTPPLGQHKPTPTMVLMPGEHNGLMCFLYDPHPDTGSLHPDTKSDHQQNLEGWSCGHSPRLRKILSKSVHNCFSYLADKQRDRQINVQTMCRVTQPPSLSAIR